MTKMVRSFEKQVPLYYRSLDFEALWRDYPPAPDYFESTYQLSRDELHALQNRRFLQQVKRAWDIPFYQRHWAKAGIRRSDVRGLDDLTRLQGGLSRPALPFTSVGANQLIVAGASTAREGRIVQGGTHRGARNHGEGVEAVLASSAFVLDARRSSRLVVLWSILGKCRRSERGQHGQCGQKLLHITSPVVGTENTSALGIIRRQLWAANVTAVAATHRRRLKNGRIIPGPR
jgi:hypothetical protein